MSAESPGNVRDNTVPLDEIHLGIGDSLQLQSRAPGDNTRHQVRLIGYARNRAVLVTTPLVDGAPCLIREGHPFVVRFFSGRSAYAFATSVRKSANVPQPHLFLDYPAEVRGLQIRQSARAETQLPASVPGPNGAPVQAMVRNISLGGALLQSARPLGAVGDTLALSFCVTVQSVEQTITTHVSIRTSRKNADEGTEETYETGVQFLDLAAKDQLALTGFVYQTLFEQGVD